LKNLCVRCKKTVQIMRLVSSPGVVVDAAGVVVVAAGVVVVAAGVVVVAAGVVVEAAGVVVVAAVELTNVFNWRLRNRKLRQLGLIVKRF
jgi:hypothetical protein